MLSDNFFNCAGVLCFPVTICELKVKLGIIKEEPKEDGI